MILTDMALYIGVMKCLEPDCELGLVALTIIWG